MLVFSYLQKTFIISRLVFIFKKKDAPSLSTSKSAMHISLLDNTWFKKADFPLLWTAESSQSFFAVPEKVFLWKILVCKEFFRKKTVSHWELSLHEILLLTGRIWNINPSLPYFRLIVLCFSNLEPHFCVPCESSTWCTRCISLESEISVRPETFTEWKLFSCLLLCCCPVFKPLP